MPRPGRRKKATLSQAPARKRMSQGVPEGKKAKPTGRERRQNKKIPVKAVVYESGIATRNPIKLREGINDGLFRGFRHTFFHSDGGDSELRINRFEHQYDDIGGVAYFIAGVERKDPVGNWQNLTPVKLKLDLTDLNNPKIIVSTNSRYAGQAVEGLRQKLKELKKKNPYLKSFGVEKKYF
ncbi:MAG: hypothetical protein ABIA76_01575 [Candidatus Diapherotrites archaeon]